jgi:DNA topoisomerase I
MQLIISEKAIAGERIAEILAESKVTKKNIAGAKIFEFTWKGEETRLIPLRGHISDVEFPKKYSRWKGIDVRDLINAEIIYSESEPQISSAIKDSAPDAEKIIIATDADREGESIGLEALNYAKLTNPSIKVERAYFSAIIKEDIEKSFSSLEKFDYNFAHSADARREIDLIWGAVLTRFISLISGRIGHDFLSVGRVQTPTLAIIINREKERLAFKSKKYWEIIAHCEKNGSFTANHREEKFWDEKKAKEVFEKNPKSAKVTKVESKTRNLARPEPFNTTEFLRSASAIGISAGKAMNLAESLYQRGFISYPRTDNKAYPKNLDLRAILNKLVSVHELMDDVNKILQKKNLSPSAGKETKDHPPIHPVSAVQKNMISPDEWKVYELVVRRFLATLSEDAKTENVLVLLDADGEPYVAHGQVILKAGWKAFYPYSKTKEVLLPKLSVGDIVSIEKLEFNSKETQPPGRYSQSSLIKLMEQNNLGTKSTRPNIIQKLYSRNYISGNKSIEPSQVAFAVIDSLDRHCDKVTKPQMTAELEEEMEEIAAGKKIKPDVVNDSGKDLREIMDSLMLEKDVIGSEIRSALKDDSVLGPCGKCNDGQLVIRKGKSGKRFAGCSSYPKCTNSFPLPQKGTIITTVDLCPECNTPIIQVKNGRFTYKMCIEMACKTKENWKKKSSVSKTVSPNKIDGEKNIKNKKKD